MLSYLEAYNIIRENFKLLKPEIIEVGLLNSLNHILAEDIISDINMPPFDNSSMDGYAIKFNPEIKKWKIIGEIPAGANIEISIDEHSTVEIMTGARLPQGADSVIPLEDVIAEEGYIKLMDRSKFNKGEFVRWMGEDLKVDSIAVPKYTLISPKNISLVAACGVSKVKVFSPLKIGILATGDELIDINEKPKNDSIRASNNYSLFAAVKAMNMLPVDFGFISDNKELIKEKLKAALDTNLDILITTGGVSVGKYDYLRDVIEETGARVIFWKVNIKPGKPLLFCVYEKKGRSLLIFGLPGNPVSALVGFNLFIKRNIYDYFSIKRDDTFKAVLSEELHKDDRRKHFVWAYAEYDYEKGVYSVSKSGGQSSGNMAGLSNANCLLIFDEEKDTLHKGEVVECIRF
jgi:molybdopterin molybdotransferase